MKNNSFIFLKLVIILNLGLYSFSFAQDTSKSNFVSSVWINSFQINELNQIKSCRIKSIKEYEFVDSNNKRKLILTGSQYFDQCGKISFEQNFIDYSDDVPYSIIYKWLNDSNAIAYVRYKKKYKNFLNSTFGIDYAEGKRNCSMLKSYNKDSNEIKVFISIDSNFNIRKKVIFDSINKPLIVFINEPLDIESTNAINSPSLDLNYSNIPKTEFIYNDRKQLVSILNGSFESLFTYAKIDLYYSEEGKIYRKVYDRILTDSIIDLEYIYNGDTTIFKYSFNKYAYLNRKPEIITSETTKWKNFCLITKRYLNGFLLNEGSINKYTFWK